MFYGEYAHYIDNKGRLILPSKFRETAKSHFVEKFFITRGLDKCLFMFTEEEWKAVEQKFKSMPFTNQDARKFNRIYFSGAVDLIPDKQGRVLVPGYLKEYAGIKRDVVVIGVSNRIEIWGKDQWHNFYQENLESFEGTAEKLIEGI
ncbi:MAG: division/cell wall cluster transcriptional repressor MraZ [Candidatus Omnitrophota bacterium]